MKKVIESQGIYGFDEYGDLKKFSFDDEELAEFRDNLRKYSSILVKGNSPNLTLFDEEPFCRFGWPRDRLPDFSQLKNDALRGTNGKEELDSDGEGIIRSGIIRGQGGLQPKTENAYKALVAGMLAYMDGRLTGVKDEKYKSRTMLAKILDKDKKFKGIKFDSAKDKLKEANAYLIDLGYPDDRKKGQSDDE